MIFDFDNFRCCDLDDFRVCGVEVVNRIEAEIGDLKFLTVGKVLGGLWGPGVGDLPLRRTQKSLAQKV